MASIQSPPVSGLRNDSRRDAIAPLRNEHFRVTKHLKKKRGTNCKSNGNDNGNPRSRKGPPSIKNGRIDTKNKSKKCRNKEEQSCIQSSEKQNVMQQTTRKTQHRSKETKRGNKKIQKRREEKDWKLAQLLQDAEERAIQKLSLERSHMSMMKTNTGKAVLVVERVIQLVESIRSANEMFRFGMKPVAKDDMVFFAERLLAKQQEFNEKGIPCGVDIGFHYTREENMNHIETNGLMTRKDRIDNKIHVQSKGAIFGDGVYTANNPTSFMKFGKVGLIVARLQGKTVRIAQRLGSRQKNHANTIIGDKSAKSRWRWPKSDSMHEIVLQNSSQCLPLIRYDRKSLSERPVRDWKPDDYILLITNSLYVILDEIFNGRKAVPPPPPLPLSSSDLNPARA